MRRRRHLRLEFRLASGMAGTFIPRPAWRAPVSVLFRRRAPHLDDHRCDALHQSVATDLFNRGITNLAVVRYDGRTTLKMTLLNPATDMSPIPVLMPYLKRLAVQPSREPLQ
ncbi:hypothetical protein RSP797_06895 [Ralstonia solanacearum]|nr:hypothetical protein RSP797_06895 [Ralstonia solanacearum]